jgi:hypothetical protein
MAPMGTAEGDWYICLQLLHSTWPATQYQGLVTLKFNDIESNDVSTPVCVHIYCLLSS